MNKFSTRLLLCQLPLLYNRFELNEKFIPLSIGYLAAHLSKTKNIDSEILNFTESNLSDKNILDMIYNKKPNIIGFSCYVWNLERTLYFANQLKKYLPDSKIILGGPEISRDNPLIFDPAVDVLVFGEGEEAIIELMDCFIQSADIGKIKGIAYKIKDNFVFTNDRIPINNLDNIASPYLSESTKKMLDESNYALLETRRGCPYRCAYCFYGKGTTNLRSFSIERIIDDFIAIKQKGIESAYFIDSCFNTNKYFAAIISKIAEMNTEPKVDIQIEVRAELVDENQVRLMKNANITRVEVGLQSRNEDALKTIHRFTDFNKFEKGVRLMLDNGINVIIGAIHGLPGDNLDSLKNTVDYIIDRFPEADKHFYPLCVLPSTDVRKRADTQGIKYQASPPYLIINNEDVSWQELREAFKYSKKAITDKFESIPLLTFFSGKNNFNLRVSPSDIGRLPLISRIYLEDQQFSYEIIESIISNRINIRLANSLVLFLKSRHEIQGTFGEIINRLLVKLFNDNPYLALNLFLEYPQLNDRDVQYLFKNVVRAKGYLDYMNLYHWQELVDIRESSINATVRIYYIEGTNGNRTKKIRQLIFDDSDIQKDIFVIEQKHQGFLIETNNETPSKAFFEKLASEIEPGMKVRFKNLIAQKVWDEVINKGVTNLPLGESTLMATKDGLQTAYFNRSEIMLDAAEWILTNK